MLYNNAKSEAMAHLMLISKGLIVPYDFKRTREAYNKYGSFYNMYHNTSSAPLDKLHATVQDKAFSQIWDLMENPDFMFDVLDCEKVKRMIPFFAQSPYAPPILYAQGNIDLLSHPSIFVTGQRFKRKVYGENIPIDGRLYEIGKYFCKDFVEHGECLMTSLSQGIETEAVNIGTRKNAVIAILGTSLTGSYPSKSRVLKDKLAREQLVISAQPPFLERVYKYPNGYYYVNQRNKLIAQIADALFVSQAPDDGWAYGLIDRFRKVGKNILTSYENSISDIGSWQQEEDVDILEVR